MTTTALTIPVLLKHTALAIYKDGGLKQGPKERLHSALNIARARLVEYKFLEPGSETCPIEKIRLTGKGSARNLKHLHEQGARAKSDEFDQLYARYMAADKDTDEPRTKPDEKVT